MQVAGCQHLVGPGAGLSGSARAQQQKLDNKVTSWIQFSIIRHTFIKLNLIWYHWIRILQMIKTRIKLHDKKKNA